MSVRRSHRGKWMVDIKGFRHPDGRVEPRIRQLAPIQTRRGAESFERQVRQALLDGTWGREPKMEPEPEPVPTIEEFAEEFMATYVRNHNKLSEVRSKESILRNHILPWFGKRRLGAVVSRDVERFKAHKLKRGFAPQERQQPADGAAHHAQARPRVGAHRVCAVDEAAPRQAVEVRPSGLRGGRPASGWRRRGKSVEDDDPRGATHRAAPG